MKRTDIRNVAIIAHVDHGKTTLVDQLLKQNKIFRTGEVVAERVMDSGDLERERGITILAKSTALHYKDVKINIVDTPGHADFGGEVERILSMVDGVILLIDAVEGCMPQTRYVLKNALGLGKKAIVTINKIGRGGDLDKVTDQIIDLFIELGANDDQIDFTTVYASGKQGWASLSADEHGDNMDPLLDTVLKDIPCPEGEESGGLQALICNLDYDDYVGKIGIARVKRGSVKVGQPTSVCHIDGSVTTERIVRLYQFEGLKRVEVESASIGDIIAVNGPETLGIGDTVCSYNMPEPLPFVKIDEPTLSMLFMVNDSPFAGKEGKYVTSRHLRSRLFKEVQTNVSMRVEETDSADCFKVYGRGELHLSVLIETMRREGYEFQVSRPEVIIKEIDGVKCEPIERLVVEVPAEYVGVVMNGVGMRKGDLKEMIPDDRGGTKLEFTIPSRCLIGYRNEMLTDTRGFGVMTHTFENYAPYKGEIRDRARGSIIAWEDGVSNAYGLFNAQERSTLFIGAGVKVYAGQIVGENSREDDMTVNVCKKKQLTNNRAAGSEDALRLTPPRQLSLEQCLEFIAEDELVEVTPVSIRLRKIELNREQRMKNAAAKRKM